MSPLGKNEQSQRAGEIHTGEDRDRQRETETESEMAKQVRKLFAELAKGKTEAAYWAMAAPQAEMSQLGCHMRRWHWR